MRVREKDQIPGRRLPPPPWISGFSTQTLNTGLHGVQHVPWAEFQTSSTPHSKSGASPEEAEGYLKWKYLEV